MWLAETWCIYQSRILLYFGYSFFRCLSFCIPHEGTGAISGDCISTYCASGVFSSSHLTGQLGERSRKGSCKSKKQCSQS
ncbi:hypothetical protein VIGAN_11228500 [Vigna angularis var. angularis]|uniref:Uncharacterized protein n=1 Tax=Vigna angularis var. angularis TaxID=157739 RepID=A0A0S3TC34_PHAAN|nr:hypothetical protein VIGAN_11228500 [Vigna angularis var. angularis]